LTALMIEREAGPLSGGMLRPNPPGYTTRFYERDDYRPVLALLQQNFPDAGWTGAKMKAALLFVPFAFTPIVAVEESSGKVVGCITPRNRWGMGEFSWIATDADLRHQGIGSLLIRACAAFLYSVGFARFTGVMNPVQPKVQAFWESLGFTIAPLPPETPC
jgi:GNAT superfamily N-acetyltransferase